MSPEDTGPSPLGEILARPQEARLAAYLALRPMKSLGLEPLARIVDLRPDWIQDAFRAWVQAGLPLRVQGDTWSWDDLEKIAGDAAPALRAAKADHKAKFEIQEILVFLESETASRRPRG